MARRLSNRTRRGSTREVPASPPRRPCVVYARVSSKEQEREGFSIPAQQRLLNSYADDQGLQVVKEFVDVETAKRAGRTNFTKMLAWLKKNRTTCRTILVEKTDRLYRNLKDWVVLDELDLEIHLVKEGIVLSDEARSTDKFMHGIRVLMAKNYIDNLSEEATKGMREKASQGIWPSSAPLGYVNVLRDDGKRVIEPDPNASPMIHQLFEWAATGDYSLKVLTKKVAEAGLLSRRAKKPLAKSVVHHLLRNPIYMGEFEWAGEVYQGIHAPIVSRELWDRVQEVFDDRYQGQRDTSRAGEFAYPGMVRCGLCGSAMSPYIVKERYIYYRCAGAHGPCEAKQVREEVLDREFARALRGIVLPPSWMEFLKVELRKGQAEAQRFHQESIDRLEGECARLQRRLDQMYVDKLDGLIDADTYSRNARQWQEDLRAHRRAMSKHDDAKQSYLEEGLLILSLAQEAPDLFEKATRDEKRELLTHLVSNSSCEAGRLTIEWRKPYVFLSEFQDPGDDEPPSEGDLEGGPSNMVGVAGFEPTAFCSRSRRATRLRYTPYLSNLINPPPAGKPRARRRSPRRGPRRRRRPNPPPAHPRPPRRSARRCPA